MQARCASEKMFPLTQSWGSPVLLPDPALAAIAQALLRARLYLPAAPGPQIVNDAGNLLAELSFERGAALLRADELQMPLAPAVDDGQLAQQLRPPVQRRARRHLDVVGVLLGPILVGVAAAGAARLTIESHFRLTTCARRDVLITGKSVS